MRTEQELIEEWKKVFPKSLLQENDFDKLLNSPVLKNNKNAFPFSYFCPPSINYKGKFKEKQA